MSELEEWQKNSATGNNENGDDREGYRPYNRENKTPGREGRPQRPRFNRTERAYSASQSEGFRPASFGNRNNMDGGNRSNSRGGYQQRGDYQPRGEYQPRGGYQQRGGYSSRNGYQQGGDYSQRGDYPQRGGYQQGGRGRYYNENSSNEGGYDNGGYSRGYNNGYNAPSRGDYQQRGGRGGYQQGGYNRGGYNKAYGQQGRGGYKPYGGRQHSADYNPNAKYSLKKQIEYKEYLEDPNAPIRLNKFLANAGVCSRREADQFIQAGVVSVNGTVVTELGTKVQRTDEVHFHDQLVSIEKKVYVLLNKPKDYVTTSDDPQQRKTVMDLIKNCCRERIYPVGRLDRNTTGVLLFTNDGELASRLTHPKFQKKKIYHVHLDKNCAADDLRKIAEGIELEDGIVKADDIAFASDTDRKQIGIEIHSGKNRIVRRIFEHLGYKVCKLDRVMFAGLTKKGLKRGDWRFLTEQEVAMLHMGRYE